MLQDVADVEHTHTVNYIKRRVTDASVGPVV